MKNTELRIGNYFQWTSIAAMGRGVDRICYGQEIEDYMDFKEGIPLTPEWLEKFGAIFPYNDARCQIGNFCFYYNPYALFLNDSGYNEAISDHPITYVHQLQNLYFALTGEELELKQ